MAIQDIMWLGENIQQDSTHRLVTDEQIEKWNGASSHEKLKIQLPTQFDSVIYDTSAAKNIIATLDEYIGAAPGTLKNDAFTSLDEYKYPGDYVISNVSNITNMPDENITDACLTVKMISANTEPKFMQILYDISDESKLNIYIRYSAGYNSTSISVNNTSISLIANQTSLTNWYQTNHTYLNAATYAALQWNTEWRKIQLV